MNEIVNEVSLPSMRFGYDSEDILTLITIEGDHRYVLDDGIGRDAERTRLLPIETRAVELQCSSCRESFSIEAFGGDEPAMPRYCPWCGREVER